MNKRPSDPVIAARATKKANTSCDSFRNRLFLRFGNLIHKKDGSLPSSVKGLVSLVLRTFAKIKHGADASINERSRTVTVGLETVLNDDSQREKVLAKLKSVSDYMSEVRVNASLFANYLLIKLYNSGQPLPERTTGFFEDCLKLCGGSKFKRPDLRPHFDQFTQLTGISPLTPESGVDQVRHYEADKMATAAASFLENHFTDRRASIMKWHFTSQLSSNGRSEKLFKEHIHTFCDFIVSDDRESDTDLIERVKQCFISLGFLQHEFASVEHMINTVLDFYHTSSDKLQHLIELQELFITEDRRHYEGVVHVALNLFPTDNSARTAYIAQHWSFTSNPPKCMAPLPFCDSHAVFIRVDKKAMQQMCGFSFDEVSVS